MRNPFRSKYTITQKFGENPSYYQPYGFSGHEGLDIVPTGTVWDIMALEDGIVVRDEDTPRDNYGIYVVLWHPSIKKGTWYCHLAENNVQYGEQVKKGQKIGVMGSTGKVTGAHLHLGLVNTDENGNRINLSNGYKGFIDPLPWLEEGVSDELSECLIQHMALVTELDEVKPKLEEKTKLLLECNIAIDQNKNVIIGYENFIKNVWNFLKPLSGEMTTENILAEIKTLSGYQESNRICNNSLEKMTNDLKDAKTLLATAQDTARTASDELKATTIAFKDEKTKREQAEADNLVLKEKLKKKNGVSFWQKLLNKIKRRNG